MAYDKKEIFDKAMNAIKENDLYFIEDVVAYLPCSKETFYQFFPLKSDESDALKEELERNKVKSKVGLRKDWRQGNNPTSQLALYRLIGSDEERRKLSTSYQEITGNDGQKLINSVTIEVVRTREEADESKDNSGR